MPRSGSTPPAGKARVPTGPRAALDALLAEPAGDPVRRALWLDTLDQRLRPHLPPGAAAHARLANVRGDRLVFIVDTPVWHARLRLASQDLVDAARSIGLDVVGLNVKTTLQPLRPFPAAAQATPSISAAGQSQLAAALALLRSGAPEEDPAREGVDRPTGSRRGRKAPADPASGAS
jgi:hypothetical protein